MLSPYRALDLTDGRAELATMILAGFGADVIKVEPPGGAASRHASPLGPDAASDTPSLGFRAYNRGKRSVVVDVDTAEGRDRLLELAATADFVFENAGPGVMDERGIGFEALRAVRPDLVYVAISPFGQTGPYAHHLATDLTLSAMGGAMALNGDRDRRPVRVTVPQVWHHAAAESTLGALVAHHRRVESGEAQFVDMSVQTAVFWTGLNAMISAAIDGRNIERGGTALQLSTITAELVYPCADGEICMFFMGPTLLGLIPWMLQNGIVDDDWVAQEDWTTFEQRILSGEPTVVALGDLQAKITELTCSLTKQQIFAGALERGLTMVPVNTAADTVAMEQLAVRDYWDEIDIAGGQTARAPGPFVKATNSPIAWSRPAPALGDAEADIAAELSGARNRASGQGTADSAAAGGAADGVRVTGERRLPLEGVKVADFSWIGVGPITAKSLADHGATVVHIESDSPADRLRLVGPFTDDIAGVNRCQFFGSFNTSKLSLQLNLKHPTGQEVARRALEWCDIALDSFTAGTMNRLGLGYDVARELNPSIIMATTCLFGQTGPLAKLAGYGYHAAAISGFYEITGWDDRAPGGPWNAYTDTIAPRFLTSTLLAALDHRRRTGQGQYIDQAQAESSLHFQSPELLDVQISGVSPRRNGNVDLEYAPHDAYPCAGQDQWCAIAIQNDDQWKRLCGVMGNPAWSQDETFDTVEGRRTALERIDAGIGDFTRNHEPRALMDLLQDAGVPAGMVQRSSDHLQDPQLAHRQFFRRLVHPEMGEVPYEGHQYRISGYDNGPRFPAPCLGEHTFEVLTDVFGYDIERAGDILISGACG